VKLHCSTAFIQPAALKSTARPYVFIQLGISDVGRIMPRIGGNGMQERAKNNFLDS
jgi:lysophospholipase L1-like esterase